jgi:2-desacetyl-2-hydroxyethyl bacteriochlorophyllide A dehydrogenase
LRCWAWKDSTRTADGEGAHVQGKELIFRSDRKVEIEEFEIPEPGPGQALIRNEFTHVSAGSEMNFFRLNPVDGPLVKEKLGYMAVGEVVAVGPGVVDYVVGDRVLNSAFHQSHWTVDLNSESRLSGPHWYIDHVDPRIPAEQAGFITLGDVALHGLRRAQPQIDESAAVIGCGIVGQLTIQMASIAGMHPIIATDLVDSRLDKARLSGATHTVNAGKEDLVAAVRAITGDGAETVFACAPVPSTLQPALEMAAKRGVISLVASVPGTAQIGLQVELLRRELTIVGTYEADMDSSSVYWPWSRMRNRRAVQRLILEGRIRLDHLITHVVPYTEAESMFAAMHDPSTDWMGVVFDWG